MDAGTVRRALALSHFLLTVAACLVLYAFPGAGLWPVLLSIVPFGVRLFVDRPLFHNILIDGLLAAFLVTALIGYWSAYDPNSAGIKLSLLVAGVLLYYAISTQPGPNLGVLSGFWFVFGVGVSLYFLLTLDFGAFPAKFQIINQIGLKWMSIRPAVSWPAIQPTDTAAGIALITSIYGLYFLAPGEQGSQNKLTRVVVLFGFGVVFAAVVLATSRGALVALAAAIVVLSIWLLVGRFSSRRENVYRFFPAGVLLFVGLMALLLILPLGIFGTGFFIGENLILNRSELIRNGIFIMRDFPFLGGGLGSFPGLFSRDILVIPYYSLLNSHNIFVDVSIEQGMIAGFAFLLLYSIGLWKTASILTRDHPVRMQVFYGCVFSSIFISIVHGLVDDYLYSGWWTALALFPVAMSILATGTEPGYERAATRLPQFFKKQTLGGTQVYSRGLQLAVVAFIVAALGLSWNRIAAQWFANLGAVKMDRVELTGYPANKWDEGGRINELQSAKMLFIRSLGYDATNWIANYHLGLIEMSERDFSSAADHLVKSHRQNPGHRGIIKNLGYSYAWLGEMDKARLYLEQIPEAKSELDVYVWWWDTQGRHDLSANAGILASRLKAATAQQE